MMTDQPIREAVAKENARVPESAPAVAQAVPAEATGRPAAPSRPRAEKELLCTICNLRACWEAPEPAP